jgi:hypothetical protein
MSEDGTPISNGDNGEGERGANGRFLPGNRGGPGNPRSQLARQLRSRLEEALHKACSPDRLLAAVDAILKCAEAGDVAALRLLCERIAGPPVAADVLERIEALEAALDGKDVS